MAMHSPHTGEFIRSVYLESRPELPFYATSFAMGAIGHHPTLVIGGSAAPKNAG